MSDLKTLVLTVLCEKLGQQIVAIDMSQVNPYTDTFVIVTARNTRHADTLAQEVLKAAKKAGYPVHDREGENGSAWILVDLYDVVVHIFTQEGREQYQLDHLWSDQPMEFIEENNPAFSTI